MSDTRFVWDSKIDTARLAIGYDKDGNAYQTVKRKAASAADDLMATIEDYGNFLVSVMNGEGLSKEIFTAMTTSQVASTRGKHFGLGFERYDLGRDEYALSHGGSDDGVRTFAFIFPKSKRGLLIFTNADTGGSLYEKIVKHYLGDSGREIFEIETK